MMMNMGINMEPSVSSDRSWMLSSISRSSLGYHTVFILLLHLYLCTDPAAGGGPSSDMLGPQLVSDFPTTSVKFSNATGYVLDCETRGQPPPKTRWYQLTSSGFEQEVSSVERLRTIAPNGSLVFPPFQAIQFRPDVHNVAYRCRVSNVFGLVASPVVHVTAIVEQYFEVQVYDEFTIAGNTAVLRCHVPSFVRDYIIITGWQARPPIAPKVEPIENDGRYSIFATGELHVRNVQMSDGLTNFRCVAKHTLTGETKLSSYGRLIVTDLKINVAPKMTDFKGSVVAKVGEDAELPCAAQAYPSPKYVWYKAVGESLTTLPSHRYLLKGGSLLLQKVRSGDSGRYVCIVSNQVGEERTFTSLHVAAELRVSLVPHLLTVHIGKSAVLNCSVNENHVDNIQWLKDGQPILGDERFEFLSNGRILHINSIQRYDGGMFQCLVADSQGASAQGTAQLTLGDSAPVIVESFKSLTLTPNEAAALKCSATGSPAPEISWFLDDAQVVPDRGGYFVNGFGVPGDSRQVISWMNISRAKVDDGGEWRCEAANSAGAVSFAGRINVKGRLAIRPMANRSVVAGRDVVLHCRVIGYPLESIVWNKGGRPLPLHHRQKVFPNGTLIVFSLTTDDAGQYSCVARGPDNNATANLSITVKVPPLIERFAFDENLYEGMRTRVYCNIARGDQPLTIRWLKNNLPLQSGAQLQVRSLDAFSVALVIDALNPAHNGNYTCMASNDAAVVNYTAILMVHVPPHWVREPKDSSAVEGYSIHVDCMATGHPLPRIIWQRGGTERQSSEYKQILSGPDYQIFENGTLRIAMVRYQDRGPYLCQAANGVGSGLSTVVQLNVQVPARIEHAVHNNTVKLGSKMALNCPVRGDHPIRVRWSKNGQPIGKESKTFGVHEKNSALGLISSLVIHKVAREDSGTYTCAVSNKFGNDEMQVRLYVQEPPEPVEGFNITSVSSRSVNVVWREPYNGNSPITYYLIQYKNRTESAWDSEQTINVTVPASEQTSWTVRGLGPDILYYFRIQAANEVGIGPPSTNLLKMRTEEEVPAGPPTNVYVQAADSTSLRVSWNPPVNELRNGRIKGYYVGYKLYNSSELHLYKTVEAKAMKNSGQLGECMLHNLRKFTKYSILVQAYNSIGAGPRSDEMVVSTAEDVPQIAPTGVYCHVLSTSSMKVSWNSLDVSKLDGILRGYQVIYQLVDTLKIGQRETDDVSTSLQVEGLEVYSNYSIRVAGISGGGVGQRTTPIFCRTHESVPEEPEDIKALVLASDAIIVSWRPPRKPNGLVQTYTVYEKLKDSFNKENSRRVSVPSGQLYHEVRNLRSGQRYEFWVTASTSVGEGPPSKRAFQTPDIKAPARVASFSRGISVVQKQDIELDCRVAGLPFPQRTWKINDRVISSGSPRIKMLASGAIRIENVKDSDAAKYTCHVANSYGKDHVEYALTIASDPSTVLPPKPQDVEVIRTSFNSVTLSWLRKNTSSPITSYELYYSREAGSWLKVKVPTGEGTSVRMSHELMGLYCGTQYQLYLIAHNPSGHSEASETVSTKTLGEVPRAPRKEHFIVSNSTSLTLRPSSWDDNGCPISHLTIEYRPRPTGGSHSQWIVVSRNLSPDEGPMTLHDLRPEMWYSVRVTATNDAGSTDAEFTVRTVPNSHVTPELMVHDQSYEDLALVVPLVVIVLVIVAGVLTSAALLFCCKNKATALAFFKPQDMSAGSMDDLSSFGVYDDLQKPGAVPSKQVSQQTLSVLAHPHLTTKPLMATATLNRHRRRPPPFSKAASNDNILCEKSNTAQSNHYDNPRSKNWENGASSNSSGVTSGAGGGLAAVAANGPTSRPFLLADSRTHDCKPIAMEIFDYETPMGTIKERQRLGHQTLASTSWREADRFEPRVRMDDHFYLDNEDCTTKFDGDSSYEGADPNGGGHNSRDDASATSDDATSRGDTSSAYNFSYRVALPPPERKFL
ncbi:Down syndrome cell adhesion molecule-like protein Dscam2 isoform X3 [Varroa destructor]|uniref:Down syndrome cell adhesion molecule-like protein Dscam2 n=1 Tax=Varroa destructor TaxID=109461 RepID=A0A7M7K542_VARDE|nr:Down syndrome cell adhesion molecule-like protein Dscam2 isoform X3 [Varroa destructor]